jgi:hypothetical protein
LTGRVWSANLCWMEGLGSGPGAAIAGVERRRTELADVF